MKPVHPRACGERGGATVKTRTVTGSSPRMRGTVVTRTSALVNSRFIPAHAGNGLPVIY